MNKNISRSIWVLIAIIVVGGAYAGYKKYDDLTLAFNQAGIPSPVPYEALSSPTVKPVVAGNTTKPPQAVTPAPAKTTAPAKVNLAVPFTVQAPNANWELPYGEFCEEASVVMAMAYIKNEPLTGASDADKKMKAIQAYEEKKFGYYKDTTAAEVATTIKDYYKYDKVKTVPNPTVQDIKQALAEGKVVIVPAAGQLLGNPYFQQPGPPYHMFVIKGYTGDGKFIVNDPGTRRGADYIYSETVIMNALHDWNGTAPITEGRKVIVIVG